MRDAFTVLEFLSSNPSRSTQYQRHYLSPTRKKSLAASSVRCIKHQITTWNPSLLLSLSTCKIYENTSVGDGNPVRHVDKRYIPPVAVLGPSSGLVLEANMTKINIGKRETSSGIIWVVTDGPVWWACRPRPQRKSGGLLDRALLRLRKGGFAKRQGLFCVGLEV